MRRDTRSGRKTDIAQGRRLLMFSSHQINMKAALISIWAAIFFGTIVLWRVIILKTRLFSCLDKIAEPLALLFVGCGSVLFTYIVGKGAKKHKTP